MSEPIKHEEAERIHREDLAHAVKGTKKAKRAKSVIDVCREIKAEHGAKRFRGTLVDAFTASAIVAVYDAINEENKAKYAAMDDGTQKGLIKMANVAFKLLKK